MRVRIKNYWRFMGTTLLAGIIVCLFVWGIFTIVTNVFEPASKARHLLSEDSQTTQTDDSTDETDSTGAQINDNEYLVLVNKDFEISDSYDVSDLVTVPLDGTRETQLKEEASNALVKLFDAAEKQGYRLVCVSGYRDYATQQAVHAAEVASLGEALANQESATAGHSEHETGLAMDISTAEMNYDLDQSFIETDAGKWVDENCATYGFIIRYPLGKESVTGYTYEPWHLRYVGIEAAKEIMSNNSTLEEYIQQQTKS